MHLLLNGGVVRVTQSSDLTSGLEGTGQLGSQHCYCWSACISRVELFHSPHSDCTCLSAGFDRWYSFKEACKSDLIALVESSMWHQVLPAFRATGEERSADTPGKNVSSLSPHT